jgi:hypothetical protein
MERDKKKPSTDQTAGANTADVPQPAAAAAIPRYDKIVAD